MIKKIYDKHTVYFWVFSTGLSLLALGMSENFLFSNNLAILLVCFLLILTVGISHGALDNFKANKILKIYKVKNKSIFYLVYIMLSILIIIFWVFLPTFTLLLFLFVASYHFGKEDTCFINKSNSSLDRLFYLLKGSLIIFAPLFFHIDETLKIFEILYIKNEVLFFIKDEHWIINIFLGLGVLGYFYFLIKSGFVNFKTLFLDIFSILILNVVFPPLIAFTVYFCFLHSVRHAISLSNELDKSNFESGFGLFVKKALPLTLITGILYVVTVVFLSNSYGLNDAVLKVIFIGLASLTFPHILLEYLIEKNEKRN
tara:strand:+ start:179 stop:1120 length:942 start_codon:yes stop_codon:yes gene_type:complete